RLTGSFSKIRSPDAHDMLLTAALQLGRIRTSPFLADEVTRDGCVLVDRRRLWPQAELLKALVVRGGPSVGRNLREDADIFADQLSATYLTDAPGGFWRDAFDCHGAFTADRIPGSSLYHLWTVIPETILIGQTSKRQLATALA
ncbi:AGE family epimerase/isomerase, partial [Sinorhizobium sp. Sb3]|uniref:AGE family epimerase/isomerase n=1 Tax=Sinorhizobium sp. Sb3 TaxID=1358417 RepID=UPI001AEC97B0